MVDWFMGQLVVGWLLFGLLVGCFLFCLLTCFKVCFPVHCWSRFTGQGGTLNHTKSQVFTYFSDLFLRCCSGGHFCTLFVIFVSPGPPKCVLLGSILSIYSWLGDLVKTMLSLQSQLDSAGPRGSQNCKKSRFFEVLILDVFLVYFLPTFSDF